MLSLARSTARSIPSTIKAALLPNLQLGNDIHTAPTRIICLENTLAGTAFPQDKNMKILREAAKHDIRVLSHEQIGVMLFAFIMPRRGQFLQSGQDLLRSASTYQTTSSMTRTSQNQTRCCLEDAIFMGQAASDMDDSPCH